MQVDANKNLLGLENDFFGLELVSESSFNVGSTFLCQSCLWFSLLFHINKQNIIDTIT